VALATLLAGLIALAVAQAATRLSTPSASSAKTSVAGENIIAYDLDRFRSDAEAARILLTASSHRGIQSDDRNYLVRLGSVLTQFTE
jgi:hypothetical protein